MVSTSDIIHNVTQMLQKHPFPLSVKKTSNWQDWWTVVSYQRQMPRNVFHRKCHWIGNVNRVTLLSRIRVVCKMLRSNFTKYWLCFKRVINIGRSVASYWQQQPYSFPASPGSWTTNTSSWGEVKRNYINIIPDMIHLIEFKFVSIVQSQLSASFREKGEAWCIYRCFFIIGFSLNFSFETFIWGTFGIGNKIKGTTESDSVLFYW